MNIKSILDTSGIDLIPYAVGLSKFNSNPPFEPTKLNDIKDKIANLDTKKLDEALKYGKELLDEESARGEKAESKAYNLIGVTGISAGFITGISSLFPKETQFTSSISLTLILAFYILIVVSLTLTVLLASKAVMVRSYARPDVSDVFQMGKQSLKEAKLDRLTAYIYCYAKNCQTHNVKVSYVIGAQIWFRNSIVIFLILAFILITGILGNTTSNSISTTETPTPITTLTQTQIATAQTTISIKPTETPPSFPSIINSVTPLSITIVNTP